jgi:hypothetical protein
MRQDRVATILTLVATAMSYVAYVLARVAAEIRDGRK